MNSNPRTSLEVFARHPLYQKDFLRMTASMLPKEVIVAGNPESPIILKIDKDDDKC
jgi:hypothetical protein